MKGNRVGYLVRLAALFAVYLLAAKIGLKIGAVSGFATLVWAPSGIALAAMLILGRRYWPAIAAAAFVTNLSTGAPFLVALGIAAGNTSEALLGSYLLERFAGFQHSMERVRDVISLLLLAAILSTAVSATIGVTSLWLGGVINSGDFWITWVPWWVGDMLGCLIFAPLFLVWNGRWRGVFDGRKLLIGCSLAALLIASSYIVFRGTFRFNVEPFTFAYLLFPILILTALRFGQRGSVTAIVIISMTSVLGTVMGYKTLSSRDLSQSLTLLQIFMGLTAVTFMTMAAVVAERERNLASEQQLRIRTRLLTTQRSRLMAINRAKDEFIALASHQLRTPATGIKQYVGMLLGNYAGELNPSQRNMLERVYESNERQIRTVNELLTVAQVDAGTLTLNRENVEPVQLIEDILAEMRDDLTSKNQTAKLTASKRDIKMSADKVKLRMALENIVDNAIKYNRPGKSVKVRVSNSNGRVAIIVRDNGIGMKKKDQQKLFKKFSRIDSPDSVEVGGTGLGLYLAKKIIDLHGGKIAVSSRVNQGSAFTINLPQNKRI